MRYTASTHNRHAAAGGADVRELVRVFKPGGGFVFNQVHNVMGDVPPENVVAMLETAFAESFYV